MTEVQPLTTGDLKRGHRPELILAYPSQVDLARRAVRMMYGNVGIEAPSQLIELSSGIPRSGGNCPLPFIFSKTFRRTRHLSGIAGGI